jgi:DNA-nicking Smr family endonuclease
MSTRRLPRIKKIEVQDGIFRKLRLGKYNIQVPLDLHKQNMQQASESLWQFLKQCQKLNA